MQKKITFVICPNFKILPHFYLWYFSTSTLLVWMDNGRIESAPRRSKRSYCQQMDDSTQEQEATAEFEDEMSSTSNCRQSRTKDYRHLASIRTNFEPYCQQTGNNHQNSSSSSNLTGRVSYKSDESGNPKQKYRKLSSSLSSTPLLSTLSSTSATTTLNNHHIQQQINRSSKSNVSTMLT